MSRAEPRDVLDRLVERVDHLHRELQREELGRVVLIGRDSDAVGAEDRTGLVVADQLDIVEPSRDTLEERAAIARCTSNDSAALHTDGRWTFALMTTSAAFGRFAVAST